MEVLTDAYQVFTLEEWDRYPPMVKLLAATPCTALSHIAHEWWYNRL